MRSSDMQAPACLHGLFWTPPPRVARLRVAEAAVDDVLLVAGVALDVALRRQQFLAALLDLEVDVRRGRPG